VLLAGDVGATKTALALFDERAPDAAPVRSAILPSRAHAGLEQAVQAFLADPPPEPITAACFGVPGPIVDGRAEPVNLPWRVEEQALAAAIPARRVRILNDLVATAHGVLALGSEALLTLQSGRPRAGNLAVIAAGTGLGEAIVVRDGDRRLVVATEGGHADFAPRTDEEVELLRFLAKQYGHVSWERVLSGPGLVDIYRFLRESGAGPEPDWLRERLAGADPAAAISEVALEDADPVCARALDLFVAAYGAEAGNLALKALALGGVFLAGGIAPKIRRRLARGGFLAAFTDKGRLSDLMAAIPVHVVLDPAAALLGAARCARALAAGEDVP
jgi:glucokinase